MASVAAEPLGGRLLSRQSLLLVWLPIAAITALHYGSGPEVMWLHDVLRRLYYLPILLAAFCCGVRGGVGAALIVALAYAPHAFSHLGVSDPAQPLEKALEMVLYLVVGGVSGVLVDRERRRQAELSAALQQLEEAALKQQRMGDQLVRAGRLAALGELVAGIAHEIKNPLHALKGTAEVVDEVVPQDAPQRQMWEVHLGELDRLEAVAQRFLSFARPAPLSLELTDPQQLLERVRSLTGAQARKQGVQLTVDLAEPPVPRVNADSDQIVQLLLNIVLNAMQALSDRQTADAITTPEGGGTVRLALASEQRASQRWLCITVTNNGPPINPEQLEHIFNPFVTTRSEGVGLGLSIAARIAEQHGGYIEAENLPDGGGVVFKLLLPLPAD